MFELCLNRKSRISLQVNVKSVFKFLDILTLQIAAVSSSIITHSYIYFFVFYLFRAVPAAYGGSQARGRIRAHARATATSWFLVGFVSAAPRRNSLTHKNFKICINFIKQKLVLALSESGNSNKQGTVFQRSCF